jgi:GNAT superfamily N-acetyltransferase
VGQNSSKAIVFILFVPCRPKATPIQHAGASIVLLNPSSLSTLNMHIRPFVASEIPRVAEIYRDAFASDELSLWLNPDAAKYPASWRSLTIKLTRRKFYAPTCFNIACVADANDGFAPEGEVLGFARWVRQTAKEDQATNEYVRDMSLFDKAEGWMAEKDIQWEEFTRANPSMSWKRRADFAKQSMRSSGFTPLKGKTHWFCEGLAVDPKYHRKGVAKRLVQWCIDNAKKETEQRATVGKIPVPLALVASTTGVHLYRSLGFKVVSWEEAAFMDTGAEGGSVCIWDPTGYWIEDIQYGGPVKRGVVEAAWSSKVTEKS